MGTPAAGTVVLVHFPFSDLSRTKLRPAVVLADAGRGDIVLCQVTSKSYSDPAAIRIEESDFERGSLRLISYVRPAKLFTGNERIIKEHIGSLNPEVLDSIVGAITQILSGGNRT